MEQVNKLEKTLLEWYSKAPHLPENVRTWLAENAWWLVIIGVVLSVLGLLSLVSVLFLASAGLSLAGVAAGGAYGAAAGVALGGVLLVTTLFSAALFVVEVVLLGMAISPLKSHKKRGWNLLFYVALLNAVVTVVVHVLSFDLVGLVWGLLWAAVGAYFLFETRNYFVGKKPVEVKKKTAKA